VIRGFAGTNLSYNHREHLGGCIHFEVLFQELITPIHRFFQEIDDISTKSSSLNHRKSENN